MDRSTAGTTSLLTNDKGSVYDLVAMFILLVGGDKQFAKKLCAIFNEFLARGYTTEEIKTEILMAFYTKNSFRWENFQSRKRNDTALINLLSPFEKYHHKELKLVSKPPTISRDINHGTLVSRTPEYFLEPVASYTIQDLVRYFIKTMPFNAQEWPIKKLTGMLKYKTDQYGIDRLLFMTDIAAEDHKANGTLFNLGMWDEYANKADQYLEEMKYSISDSEQYYYPKKRHLFDNT